MRGPVSLALVLRPSLILGFTVVGMSRCSRRCQAVDTMRLPNHRLAAEATTKPKI
jgi:hypothetical protein